MINVEKYTIEQEYISCMSKIDSVPETYGRVHMNINEIKELIKLFNEYDIAELELEMEDIKLRLVKDDLAQSNHISVDCNQQLNTVKATKDDNVFEMCSPMVGTFYRAPSPTSEPFVHQGCRINKGQVLCIIEAMKLMNEIESEVEGKLLKVLVENGQPVEYGQPLFLIELAD